MRVLERVFGQDQQAVKLNADDLSGGGLNRHLQWMTRLYKARLALVDELRSGQLNSGLVKNLSGGDTIIANEMRQKDQAWRPTHSLFFTANQAPNFGSGDETKGMRRRYRPLMTGPTLTSEEKRRNQGWEGKLYDEAEGILAWAIEGCYLWQKAEDKDLEPPAEMATWIEADVTANDSAAQWIAECVTFDMGERQSSDSLHQAYVDWFNDVYGSTWLTNGGEKYASKVALGHALRDAAQRQKLVPDAYKDEWKGQGANGKRRSYVGWRVTVKT